MACITRTHEVCLDWKVSDYGRLLARKGVGNSGCICSSVSETTLWYILIFCLVSSSSVYPSVPQALHSNNMLLEQALDQAEGKL